MKRQIKFRGKGLIHNQWIYGGLAEDRNNNVVILPKDDWRKGECVNEDTIGQFSGLPDKNGKEIYEDDIVRWEHDNKLYVIRFQSGMFYASIEECNERIYGGFPLHSFTDTAEEGFQCEIVGNIHDNPELLKESASFSPSCATCNSYQDGECTNFGGKVKSEGSCRFYQSDVIEYTCRNCGRRYEITDSDADDREKFCCKACEYGY